MIPDRLYVHAPGLPADHAERAARLAVEIARQGAPKLSGASAERLYPLAGPGFFGLGWMDKHLWYQEAGTRPHTMRALAGKTVPLWLDDPDGRLRADNPKAQTRSTASGKAQVLIFRRAAPIGARKTVRRQLGGVSRLVDVPASYPGAPGRIARRHAAAPGTQEGKIAGAIALGNVGVRWRHPGLSPRGFLHQGMAEAARLAGIANPTIVPTDRAWR